MRFIHTADWQIGKPFARVTDSSKRTRLQDERFGAIERVGELARERDAAFVVVAGDLFDAPTVPSATVSRALSAIGGIEVPVYVIPGNHDHSGTGGVWSQPYFRREHESLAPNLHVLTTPEPLVRDDAVLLPCPLARRQASDDPTAWISHLEDAWGTFGTRSRIVVAHGSVHGFVTEPADDEDDLYGSAPNRLHLERLPDNEIDYIALGDWHGTKQVGSNAWYSGAHEQDRFARGEAYSSGNALVVSVERGQAPHVETVRTGRMGWHALEHDLVDDTGVERLAERVSGLIGTRVDLDLLELKLTGAVGFAARDRLEQHLETWRNRLIRVKLDDQVRYAPSGEEVEALTRRSDDPLISQVAAALVEDTAGEGDDAEIARRALRELHRLVG